MKENVSINKTPKTVPARPEDESVRNDLPRPEGCPYCGSAAFSREGSAPGGGRRWHCLRCDRLFYEEDLVREPLRHALSALLSDTDEDNQAVLAPGSPGKDLHGIERGYQVPGDGTIWFQVEGYDNGDDGYVNLDDLRTETLADIKASLEQSGR